MINGSICDASSRVLAMAVASRMFNSPINVTCGLNLGVECSWLNRMIMACSRSAISPAGMSQSEYNSFFRSAFIVPYSSLIPRWVPYVAGSPCVPYVCILFCPCGHELAYVVSAVLCLSWYGSWFSSLAPSTITHSYCIFNSPAWLTNSKFFLYSKTGEWR